LLLVPKVRKLVVRLILVGLRMHRDWLMGY
jgi:hypothetical protein